jgi:hypothetical protein
MKVQARDLSDVKEKLKSVGWFTFALDDAEVAAIEKEYGKGVHVALSFAGEDRPYVEKVLSKNQAGGLNAIYSTRV